MPARVPEPKPVVNSVLTSQLTCDTIFNHETLFSLQPTWTLSLNLPSGYSLRSRTGTAGTRNPGCGGGPNAGQAGLFVVPEARPPRQELPDRGHATAPG